MLRDPARVEVYVLGPTCMPLPASMVAAFSETVAQVAPEVVPLPQYVNEVGAPLYVNVPSVLRVSPAGAVPRTLTPKTLMSLAITPLPGSDTVSVTPVTTE